MSGKVINYFIASSNDKKQPRVFRSPLTVSHTVAVELLRKQFGKDIQTPLMHVCFDTASKRIYVLNASLFSEDDFNLLLSAAKMEISKEFGNYKNIPPIKGSPYSSFRVRSIDDFKYTSSILDESIPIIEANLDRMPKTKSQLPKVYKEHNEFMGGLVLDDVDFIDEMDDKGNRRNEGILLERQTAPFVLINTSQSSSPSPIHKEHIILSAHREFLSKNGNDIEGIDAQADLYAIKSHLCLGWSPEEVSSLLFRDIDDFEQLVCKMQRFLSCVDSLIEDGYKNITAHNYYISFKVSKDFPMLSSFLDSVWHNCVEEAKDKGLKILEIVSYNSAKSFITVKSPLFIPPDTCRGVFKTDSDVYIYQYNPIIEKIDIKTKLGNDVSLHSSIMNQIIKDEKIHYSTTYRYNSSSRGEWAINPNVFHIKKVSDYLYAYNYIRKQCEKRRVPFKDLDVIVGPIEKLMGRGSQGGFVDDQRLKNKQMTFPYHIENGVKLMPPAILINSVTEPSCIQQITTLLHEYVHYTYSRANMYHENKYGSLGNKVGDERLKEWYNYFSDPNEIEAHLEEIGFELMIGKNEDEIIRDKVGGAITLDNYPVAMAFKKLVDRAVKKENENEKCT